MPRRHDTKQRLIQAAVHVARTRGYAHTTTRAVAEQAGVSEATIYRHFPDKFSLIHAAASDTAAQVSAVTQELPPRAGSSTVRANLLDVMGHMASVRADMAPLELAIATDPELSQARSQAIERGLPDGPPRHLAEYLAAEQSLGRVTATVDPVTTALVIMTQVFGSALGTGPSLEDSLDVLLTGLEPRT
ncbi:TetR/AcrR family transcriptional regulator [Demequina globuliformis]|uniref:TetR/AcrR family transcriptional regulator n=1 Tax=Demequina globuliformis TaxID=676202 RepID=UPI000784C803|nr:TetR/AcrR family transcriptional regulator [Demequina globuliformis]